MFAGIVNIGTLRYSSNASNKNPQKPSGTTIMPEECVVKSKSKRTVPPCEAEDNVSHSTSCKVKLDGEKQSSEKGSGKIGKYQFRYWHLLAALIVTGVAAYKVLHYEKTCNKLGIWINLFFY